MGDTGQTQKEFPPAAAEALRKGNKIEAVKIVREAWNMDLKDAKAVVEAYRSEPPPMPQVIRQHKAKSALGWVWWVLLAIVLMLVVRKLEGMG